MPVRYILLSVWVWLSIFFQLSIIQYVGLCAVSLPIPLVMIGRIYILCLIITIKSEVWTITHCLWLGHEKIVWAVCLSIVLSGIGVMHAIEAPTSKQVNTLRCRQNGRHFPRHIFKFILLNEHIWISITISLKFDPKPLCEPIQWWLIYWCTCASLDLNKLMPSPTMARET